MKSIFVLTGAGIPAESGIQTFRGMGGLWEGHRLEDVANRHGLAGPCAAMGLHGILPKVYWTA
jgi:NAD-dependent SIR2 family protein deacetylase